MKFILIFLSIVFLAVFWPLGFIAHLISFAAWTGWNNARETMIAIQEDR